MTKNILTPDDFDSKIINVDQDYIYLRRRLKK